MVSRAGVFLRRYRPSDLDAVIGVFLAAIREVASKDYDPAQIDAWAQADRRVWEERRLSRPTWVAALGGAVVGFTDLEPDGHLDMMFVHPAHQGLGVASSLLGAVEDAAVAQGLPRIFTEASLTARPFFERRGFQVLARQRVETRGQLLTNFRMQKVLDQNRFPPNPAVGVQKTTDAVEKGPEIAVATARAGVIR